MPDPNTPSPKLLETLAHRRRKDGDLPPQPIQADEAAAQCLSLLTDPNSRVLPAEAFRELKARNDALLSAPKAEIQAALGRQAVLLEATATRFLSKAATAKNDAHAALLTKISLSASRSLLSALAAVYAITKDEEPEGELIETDA